MPVSQKRNKKVPEFQ